MDIWKQLRETGEFNELCLEHLVDKARVSARRKSKFKHKRCNEKRTPRLKRTGEYKDTELMKGPKYWRGRKPPVFHNPIRSYHDLAEAVGLIISGKKGYHNYMGKVTGLNSARLRLAQAWKSQGKTYTIFDIVKLNYDEIKKETSWF